MYVGREICRRQVASAHGRRLMSNMISSPLGIGVIRSASSCVLTGPPGLVINSFEDILPSIRLLWYPSTMSSAILKLISPALKPIVTWTLILIAVFLGVGVLQYKHNASVSSDTSTWITFTNTTCGYSFKHPSDWKVRRQTLLNSADACDMTYLISPNNPRTFDVGDPEYAFAISRLNLFTPQFSSLHQDPTGNWEGVPAKTEQLSNEGTLHRSILRDMWGISGFISGLISQRDQTYMILLTPPVGGHTKDDIATFEGVLMSFHVN